MIELKYFFFNEKDHTIKIGIQTNKYDGENPSIGNFRHGVKWMYKNNSIELFELNTTIHAYPDPGFNYIVAIYDNASKKFPVPCHCVIYNLDGTVHKVVCTPNMIRDLVVQKSGRKGERFIGLNWAKKSNQTVLYLSVVDPIETGRGQWVEDRVLDPESGEFRECLRTWMW